MCESNAVSVARKMDEMDLALLQVIASDFSSILTFSEHRISSRYGNDIRSCNQRLEKLNELGLILPVGSKTEKEFALSDPGTADEVLRAAQAFLI